MRILLTRPKLDVESLARTLEGIGHTCCIAPLTDIVLHPAEIELPATGWIITSANAVRAFRSTSKQLSLPAFVVGPATAAAAHAAGFTDARTGAGNATALTAMIKSTLPAAGQHLVYLRGRDIHADIAGALGRVGYVVSERIMYTATVVAEFPAEAIREFEAGSLDAVIFLSTRAVAIFSQLLPPELHGKLRTMRAFVLSENIAAEARRLDFQRVDVAPQPAVASLLELIPRPAAAEPPPN